MGRHTAGYRASLSHEYVHQAAVFDFFNDSVDFFVGCGWTPEASAQSSFIYQDGSKVHVAGSMDNDAPVVSVVIDTLFQSMEGKCRPALSRVSLSGQEESSAALKGLTLIREACGIHPPGILPMGNEMPFDLPRLQVDYKHPLGAGRFGVVDDRNESSIMDDRLMSLVVSEGGFDGFWGHFPNVLQNDVGLNRTRMASDQAAGIIDSILKRRQTYYDKARQSNHPECPGNPLHPGRFDLPGHGGVKTRAGFPARIPIHPGGSHSLHLRRSDPAEDFAAAELRSAHSSFFTAGSLLRQGILHVLPFTARPAFRFLKRTWNATPGLTLSEYIMTRSSSTSRASHVGLT